MPSVDEPLLRAVVQVALEPPPLRVAGLRDPHPRRLDLGELQAQLDAQAASSTATAAASSTARSRSGRRSSAGSCSSTPTSRSSRPIGVRARPVVGQRVEQVAVAVGVAPVSGRRKTTSAPGSPSATRQRGADVLRLGVAVADVVEEAAQQPHALVALAGEAPVDERPAGDRASGRNSSAAASVPTEAANAEPPASCPASSATSA